MQDGPDAIAEYNRGHGDPQRDVTDDTETL
jgi:hypothetical protein